MCHTENFWMYLNLSWFKTEDCEFVPYNQPISVLLFIYSEEIRYILADYNKCN